MLIILLGRRGTVKEFFQGTAQALWAAIADVRRLFPLRATVFFIEVTKGAAAAAGPAGPFVKSTAVTDIAPVTVVQESMHTVIKTSAVGTGFIRITMSANLFGDGGAIFANQGSDFLKAGEVI